MIIANVRVQLERELGYGLEERSWRFLIEKLHVADHLYHGLSLSALADRAREIKLREICLALPDTKEGIAWKHPVFRVREKMFCGYEELDGKMTVGLKLEVPHADLLAQDPRVVRSQYFGKHAKWVSIDAASIDDWDDIANLIMESYLLSAPKQTLGKE